MLIGVQGQQVAANLGAGGTVKGDLVVEGDIKLKAVVALHLTKSLKVKWLLNQMLLAVLY